MKFFMICACLTIFLRHQNVECTTSTYLKYLFKTYGCELDSLWSQSSVDIGYTQRKFPISRDLSSVRDGLLYDWIYMQVKENRPVNVVFIGSITSTLIGLLLTALEQIPVELRGILSVVDLGNYAVTKDPYPNQKAECEKIFKSRPDEICWMEISMLRHFYLRNCQSESSLLLTSTIKMIADAYANFTDQVIIDNSDAKMNQQLVEVTLVHLVEASTHLRAPSQPGTQLLYISSHPPSLDKTLKLWLKRIISQNVSMHRETISSHFLPYISCYPNRTSKTEDITQVNDIATGSTASLTQITLTSTPRLLIITPCSRPHLLRRVFASLDMSLVREWVIVYTQSATTLLTPGISPLPSHPHITELYNRKLLKNLTYGNVERNIGLNYLYSRYPVDDYWVYFLDDDNVIHHNLWPLTLQISHPHIVYMQQQRTDINISVSKKCKRYHLDTGSMMTSLQLLRESRPRWMTYRYDADGFFFQGLCEVYPRLIKHIRYPASFWNGLSLNTSRLEQVISMHPKLSSANKAAPICMMSLNSSCFPYFMRSNSSFVPLNSTLSPGIDVKWLVQGDSPVVYLVDSNNIGRAIRDEMTLRFVGFRTEDVKQIPEHVMQTLKVGPPIRAVLGESLLITNERGGCPCTRDVESYSQMTSARSKICVSSAHGSNLSRTILKLIDVLTNYVDIVALTDVGIASKQYECAVFVNIRNHTSTSFAQTVALQCPGKCFPAPYFEVPANLSVLGNNQLATCSMTHGAAVLDTQTCEEQDKIVNYIRVLAMRRIKECHEHILWPYKVPQKYFHGKTNSSTSNSFPGRLNLMLVESGTTRTKVGGLIIWIGSTSYQNIGDHQLKSLFNWQLLSKKQGFDASKPYADLSLVGWHATEVVYPCKANTTRCENLNDGKLYHRFMPYSELDSMSPEWSCMQRRTLRSLAHLLLLFDPGFVLIADEITYVNVKMVLPGGVMYSYVHKKLTLENKVVNGIHKSRTVTKQGYFNGGAGYLFGRGVLSKIESTTLLGPQEKFDEHRTELQLQRLSVLRLASTMAWRTCPWCVRLHGRDLDCQEIGSIGTLAVRLIDICANLFSGMNTCYHGDHAMSRCLLHGSYSAPVNADCPKGSKILGNPGIRIGMCANEQIKCNTTVHLTCKHYIPLKGHVNIPTLATRDKLSLNPFEIIAI